MNQLSQSQNTRGNKKVYLPYRRELLSIGLMTIFVGGMFGLTYRSPTFPAAAPLMTVTVSTPIAREVIEWDSYVGRFTSARALEIRPRVSGAIVGIHFRDGEIVHKGQLLFSIDRRPYIAGLAEARAGVAGAASALVLARANFDRARRLSGDEALSINEMDALRAQVQVASAALTAARARVDQRALDLEFTRLHAPIAGRISDRRVDIGNLVSSEGVGGTLLTTINALDPIYFSFNASEALFLKSLRSHKSGETIPVEIKLQDEDGYRWRGRIDFTDNGLDPQSGTIRGRAVLPNPTGFLTPGLFGNMRLNNGNKERVLLVPETAVQTDQTHKTLLIVATNGTVSARRVTLGPVIDGLRVVRSGLNPRDRVVISGTQSAIPGGKVNAKPGQIRPQAQSDAVTSDISLAAGATYAH